MIERLMKQNNCNELVTRYDPKSGCAFVIALNTIYQGRGNGGTRMKNYSSVDEGIKDALRLANAMTKKCVIIGKDDNGGFSGAKGVIIGDPTTQKTPEMLENYGRLVQSLDGRFQTGCDMNISPMDLTHMARQTKYVDGLPSSGLGDGGAATAYGLNVAMKTLCKHRYGSASLRDRIVAVQGIGSVGSDLVRRLRKEGANVIVTDIDSAKLESISKKQDLKVVSPGEIYGVKCDIFSPNASGDILTAENIKKLNCDMVIGAANNPLSKGLESVKEMHERGIIFAPDYIANIGAQVLSICEVGGKSFQHAMDRTKDIIQKRLDQVVLEAVKRGETLYDASERIVNREMSRS